MGIESCTIKKVGANMFYRPDISVGRMLKYTNIWEEPTVDFLLKLKKSHRGIQDFLFLDIGAHWGYYSVIVSHLWPKSSVAAYEPFEENLEVLKKNCPQATIFPYGVGMKTETIPYWVGTMESGRGTFVQDQVFEIRERDPNIREFKLKIKSLKECEVNWDRVGMVKIDVQGMEASLLAGILYFLKNTAWIIVENSPEVAELVTPNIGDTFAEAKLLADNNWALLRRKNILWPKPQNLL